MKFKRILAGTMAFVFSLGMIHTNVSAEEVAQKMTSESEKVVVLKEEVKEATEKEDIAKADSTEESTAKKVLLKIKNGAKTVLFAGANLSLSALKFVIKWFAVGTCIAVGFGLTMILAGKAGFNFSS